MPSATTAESRDSMPPSRARAMAEGRISGRRARSNFGKAGEGRLSGIPPNFVPIVSTGRSKPQTASPARITPARRKGKVGATLRMASIKPRQATDRPMAAGLALARASQSAASLGKTEAGSALRASPNRSLNSPEKMMMAMAAVNPVSTGWGMWRMSEPRRK